MKKETTVVISYNSVSGFKSGWHGGKRLFVCANDAGRGFLTGIGDTDEQRAANAMHRISGQFYNGAVPVECVKHYYIYAGLTAFTQALSIAKSLMTQSDAPVTVVACDCQIGEKQSLIRNLGVKILRCECSGSATLGRLSREAVSTNMSGDPSE